MTDGTSIRKSNPAAIDVRCADNPSGVGTIPLLPLST
jgi:hypothetical protein